MRDAVLVEPLEPLELKGKSQPVEAWRLLGVVSGAPALRPPARRPDGRAASEELAQLRDAFEQAVRDQSCRLVTVLGPAGIGKSRLVERAPGRDPAKRRRVLIGRCLPYGEGITYWPLRDVVRDAAARLTAGGIEELLEGDPDAQRIARQVAAAIGIGEGSAAPEETMWAVRRLFEHLAREQPLIVGFDDLQWAERTFLDLIEYVVGWSREAPILIVCLARPDLLDRHPAWHSLGDSVMLTPLSALEAEELLEHLRGETEVGPDLLGRITEAAEGNPLFVEQLLAMITENGAATGELAIPPSIHALLAARLDRLAPEERAVIEGASVIGKEFWRGAVSDLLADADRGSVGASLMTLARKEFIEPGRSIFPIGGRLPVSPHPDPRRCLSRRAEGDEGPDARAIRQLARATPRASGRASWTRSSATTSSRPSGTGRSSGLSVRAPPSSRRGPASGWRPPAVERSLPAATSPQPQASSRVPSRSSRRITRAEAELLVELGSALMMTGDFTRAGDVLNEALAIAETTGDAQLEARALIEREFHKIFAGPEDASRTIREVTARVIPILEEAGDDLGLARAWRLRSEVAVRASHWGARAEALERALEHARLAGDLREQATLVALLAVSLYYGPTPVEEAIVRCEAFLTEVAGDRSLEAAIGNTLAGLRAMRGDFDEARELWTGARSLYEELGLNFRRAARSVIAAQIETLAGDDEAAERSSAGPTRRSSGWARRERARRSPRSWPSRSTGRDATTRPQRSPRSPRSWRPTTTSSHRSSGGAFGRRCSRSAASAHRPRSSRERPAELVEDTDFPDLQAIAFLSLAEVLESAGTSAEADELVGQARETYERKGNVVAARRMVHQVNANRRRHEPRQTEQNGPKVRPSTKLRGGGAS